MRRAEWLPSKNPDAEGPEHGNQAGRSWGPSRERGSKALSLSKKEHTQACMHTHTNPCVVNCTPHKHRDRCVHACTYAQGDAQICMQCMCMCRHAHIHLHTTCMHTLFLVCACTQICRLQTQRSLLHSWKLLPGERSLLLGRSDTSRAAVPSYKWCAKRTELFK